MSLPPNQFLLGFYEAARLSSRVPWEEVSARIEALRMANVSLIRELLEEEVLDERVFTEQLARLLGMQWLVEANLEDRVELRQVFPVRLAIQYQVLPVSFDVEVEEDGEPKSTRLVLATYDPFDFASRQTIASQLQDEVVWVLAPRKLILEKLRDLYGIGADTFEQILQNRQGESVPLEFHDEASVIDVEDKEAASVVKFVNEIILNGLAQRATDIHIEPVPGDLRIRYRIDGELGEVPVPENIRALQSSVITRVKIMAKLDIAERRRPQDGRINLQNQGENIDVRVATIPTVEGESISLRLLNQERFTLDRLGLAPNTRYQVESLLKLNNGIVLVTGPTGSGKSTTLYSFLQALNVPGRRIVTIEDPVENKLDGVMQIAVKPDINLTFANGLRSILRGDPNVIMVGEIRDLETAEIAIRASLTGHLVFSTLHTNDALGGISRLIDMGVEPYLVSASVRAFIAQRLVRRLCPNCRRPAQNQDSAHLQAIGFPTQFAQYIQEPMGCERCRNTGYYGRVAIFELCMVSTGIADMISSRRPVSEIQEKARQEGFVSLRDYGWHKVIEGETSVEEVLSATSFQIASFENFGY